MYIITFINTTLGRVKKTTEGEEAVSITLDGVTTWVMATVDDFRAAQDKLKGMTHCRILSQGPVDVKSISPNPQIEARWVTAI